MNEIKSSQAASYADSVKSGNVENGTVTNSYKTARQAAIDAGIEGFDGTYKSTKASMGTAKTNATNAETSMKDIMRRANDSQAKK